MELWHEDKNDTYFVVMKYNDFPLFLTSECNVDGECSYDSVISLFQLR